MAVRVARYLEPTYEGRLEIKGQAKAFYGLRSQVVHGSKPKGDPAQTASDGLRICARVLQKIVADRCMPELDELDLGPTSPPTFPPVAPNE